MWPKNMSAVTYSSRGILLLMQQDETPRKGYKIDKLEHFTITQSTCYKKADEHED